MPKQLRYTAFSCEPFGTTRDIFTCPSAYTFTHPPADADRGRDALTFPTARGARSLLFALSFRELLSRSSAASMPHRTTRTSLKLLQLSRCPAPICTWRGRERLLTDSCSPRVMYLPSPFKEHVADHNELANKC